MDSRGNDRKLHLPRIFSLDSEIDNPPTHRNLSGTLDLAKIRDTLKAAQPPAPYQISEGKDESEVALDGVGGQQWTDKDVFDSSPRDTHDNDHRSFRPTSPEPGRRTGLGKSTPLLAGIPLRPTTPDKISLPSSSRARWEHLRRHVLHIPARPLTPPAPPAPSASTSNQSLLPSRTQTPKPSRLARLAFRHVVDQVREVAVDDTRRFASELQKFFWSSRPVDTHKPKAEREAQTMGSYLPFMSSTSLITTGASSPNNSTYGSNKKNEPLRPQSVQSMALPYRPASSLKQLQQLLMHHSTLVVHGSLVAPYIPHHSQVLSTLLRPFLAPERGLYIDGERLFAIEAFELITQTWSPTDESMAVDRSLWCCRAAASLPPSAARTRLLGILWRLLIPEEAYYPATKPETLQTLMQGLFLLIPTLHPQSDTLSDRDASKLLNDIISQVISGSRGELDIHSLEERYNATHSSSDDRNDIREAVVMEALARCLEECADITRFFLLQNTIEVYWNVLPKGVSFTPLLKAIHVRKLGSVGRAIISLLHAPLKETSDLELKARCATRLLQTRVIPEVEAMGGLVISESMADVVRIVVDLICMDSAQEYIHWGVSLVSQWYRERQEWKHNIEEVIRNFIVSEDWPIVVRRIVCFLNILPEDVRHLLLSFLLPVFNDRLVGDPPEYPCSPLTSLLDTVSRLYPQIFYKPLFSCAASSKEHLVVNHLCTITTVSRFLPDYLTRDAEMISVALMSDIGGNKKSTGSTEGKLPWGKPKLGQMVVLVELIGRIQTVRRDREISTESDRSFLETVKFVLSLESRLDILLEAKERTNSTSPSQRLLLCLLFREIRLLTRSLKAAPWLHRIVSWFIASYQDDEISQAFEDEQQNTVGEIQGLYAAAQDGSRSSYRRRSTTLLSTTHKVNPTTKDGTGLAALVSNKPQLVWSLSKGFVLRATKLLVTMSALLTTNDYRRLGPLLWDKGLSEAKPSLAASTAFLLMQCAEKIPLDLLSIIEVDLQSCADITKLNAIRKISILTNWRFQIWSQQTVMDRAHRPFKLARGPLPFVATDIGSSLYIREDDPNETKDGLPSELRKRLADIGWDQGDKPIDQRMEWIKTPMSLQPTFQLDRIDPVAQSDQFAAALASPNTLSPSPLRTPFSGDNIDDSGLLRRNSSTGGPLPSVKRRAVFVPSLSQVFPRLASLVFDSNLIVACTARHSIIDLMRNDPALLTRPALDLLTGDNKDVSSAISTLTVFLHVQRLVPPAMAHSLFNNLTGYLKFVSRNVEGENALRNFAHTVPVLAKLVNQVSGMSIREIRRAKVESFLIPSGSLWFPSSALPGPMFPRAPDTCNPFEDIPEDLILMTIIRLSQNMLFLAMLKRNQNDVHSIRKNMSRLVLPSRGNNLDVEPLELADFVPHTERQIDNEPDISNIRLRGLSLVLSRSYLLLVAQVFRSMSRHLNDRNELAILVDGLNRILLSHGDDIAIVGQVLVAFMVACTRFRRLFTTGGGYTLFMHAVVKVYTESEGNPGIRLAIEYAVNRFYVLHKEAFIFQTLDTVSHIAMLPNVEVAWLSRSVYGLFCALRRGILPSTPDPAGIHDSNKVQEREALIVRTAEEKPQTFLALLQRGDSQGGGITIELPDEYETSRFSIDDLVRLFLTVIAHDPSIGRAEQFLRLFRFITPHLYEASSSARSVLRDGIDALGAVLSRMSIRSKHSDSTSTRLDENRTPVPSAILENQLIEKSRTASNINSMRFDYFSLIVAFTRAGGQLAQPTVQRAFDLIKMMLKDSPNDANNAFSSFFVEFTRASLLRENSPLSTKTAVSFLQDLAPLIHALATTVDFSGVFNTVAQLVPNPLHASDSSFSRVVTQICSSGLTACRLAASERLLLTFRRRLDVVDLIARAVLLHGADVIAELEKQDPTHELLAGIVLPLVMTLPSVSELVSNGVQTDARHREALASAWIRLLSYSLEACERSKSSGKGSLSSSQIQTLILALQILKTIIIRAEADLSSKLPGVWTRLAMFLRSTLSGGSAKFALHNQDSSPFQSPLPSPRTSRQFEMSPTSIAADIPNTSSQERSLSSPRIVDYALWSLLELLCVYRTPLLLQMRLFMVEKAFALDQELRSKQGPVVSSRRISTSVFSKPRRRFSGLLSPGSSPQLAASHSLPHDPSFPSLDSRQQLSFQHIPASSIPPDTHNRRILHLGPVSYPSSSSLGRLLTPSNSRGSQLVGTSLRVKSLTLVKATYRRIRTVQSYLGYDTLLRMPHGHDIDVDEGLVATWTRKQALDAIEQETRDLMDEFEQSASHNTRNLSEDEIVVVDLNQSMSY